VILKNGISKVNEVENRRIKIAFKLNNKIESINFIVSPQIIEFSSDFLFHVFY